MNGDNGTAQRWAEDAATASSLLPLKTRKSRQLAKTEKSQPRKPRTARQALRAVGVLRWTAVTGPCGLAVLLLGVSMPHLAEGFQTVTQCGVLAGWLLAVAIDAAQVVAKLQLTVSAHECHKARDHADVVALGIVVSTGLLSCAMNVLAFVTHADSQAGVVLGSVVGVMLPLLILALSYTASAFALRK